MEININVEYLLKTIDNIINQLNDLKNVVQEASIAETKKQEDQKKFLDESAKKLKKVNKTLEKSLNHNKEGYYDYYDINARPEIKM